MSARIQVSKSVFDQVVRDVRDNRRFVFQALVVAVGSTQDQPGSIPDYYVDVEHVDSVKWQRELFADRDAAVKRAERAETALKNRSMTVAILERELKRLGWKP
jgi:hypothetical protein